MRRSKWPPVCGVVDVVVIGIGEFGSEVDGVDVVVVTARGDGSESGHESATTWRIRRRLVASVLSSKNG